MWIYSQVSGLIRDGLGRSVATGYSGNGAGLNNPAYENTPNVGPIPVGLYTMFKPLAHPIVGNYAIPLMPDASNQMFGRSDFYIHGDNPRQDKSASHGCIVVEFLIRERMWEEGDHRLAVIDGLPKTNLFNLEELNAPPSGI